MHGDHEQRCRRRICSWRQGERTVAALLVKFVIFVKSNRTTHGWTSASFDAIYLLVAFTFREMLD